MRFSLTTFIKVWKFGGKMLKKGLLSIIGGNICPLIEQKLWQKRWFLVIGEMKKSRRKIFIMKKSWLIRVTTKKSTERLSFSFDWRLRSRGILMSATKLMVMSILGSHSVRNLAISSTSPHSSTYRRKWSRNGRVVEQTFHELSTSSCEGVSPHQFCARQWWENHWDLRKLLTISFSLIWFQNSLFNIHV